MRVLHLLMLLLALAAKAPRICRAFSFPSPPPSLSTPSVRNPPDACFMRTRLYGRGVAHVPRGARCSDDAFDGMIRSAAARSVKSTRSSPNPFAVGPRRRRRTLTQLHTHEGVDGGGVGVDGGHQLLLASAADITSSLFAWQGHVPLWQAFGINAVLFAALGPKLNTMLTPEGFASSFVLGSLLWATLGWRGWIVCVAYLFLGQAVTKVRFEEKEKAGIAEKRGGRRGPENVWGSALTGLICAACSVQGTSFLGIGSDLYVLAYVASLATKLSDTFASEIGKAYGKTTFLITTLEKVPPGTEGAVSAEGTAAAVVGGLLLSLVALGLKMISWQGVFVATTAAFLATNAESVIGATLQEKQGFTWMTNEVVNFINTLIGASLALAGGLALQSIG